MLRLQTALQSGPKTIDELIGIGLSRAMAYRYLGMLLESGEVSRVQHLDKGNVQTAYRLTSATPPADDVLVYEAWLKMRSENVLVRNNALSDLQALSRKARIDSKSLGQLIALAKADPSTVMLEILAIQAVHAQKVRDTATIELLRTLTPTATMIAMDKDKPTDNREQALRLLQLTADFDTLSDLAVKVTSASGDPALISPSQTQFGIVIQNICANAARFPKYRNKIYDLLLTNDAEVIKRAEQILALSREPSNPLNSA